MIKLMPFMAVMNLVESVGVVNEYDSVAVACAMENGR